MLSEIQTNKFTLRTKKEIIKLLQELNIEKLTEDNISELQNTLNAKVSSLVTSKECENQIIDEELLDIYDLLTDIILDNEENLEFLNNLFLS